MKIFSLIAILVASGCSQETAAPGKARVAAGEDGTPSPVEHSPGPVALRFAKFKQDKEGKPCRVFAAGEEVRFGDFSYKIETPLVTDPETRLPWIANIEERRALSKKGMKAMILRMSVRNNAPVAQEVQHGMMFITRDGESHYGWPYNVKLHARASKRVEWPSWLSPDKWYDTVAIYDVPPEQRDDALLYFLQVTYKRDSNGHRQRILVDHAIAELAAPQPTDPIRGK
jgi:hypothetical protein